MAGVGPAGSGKTTAMRAACTVWDADGRRVIPLAASAKSADVLGAELGRRAENLHKFLHELDGRTITSSPSEDGFFVLRRGDVVLADEAGMAGTHQLHALTRHAQAAGAVIRLIGDTTQLAAVEAGGALRLLSQQSDTVELSALHRCADRTEAAVTLRLRHGDDAAIDYCQDADGSWRGLRGNGRRQQVGDPGRWSCRHRRAPAPRRRLTLPHHQRNVIRSGRCRDRTV